MELRTEEIKALENMRMEKPRTFYLKTVKNRKNLLSPRKTIT
jgi:hypothetical protein